MQTTIQMTILLVAIALFMLAAYGDIKTLRIPNGLTAAVAALGVLHLVALGDPTAALYTIGVGVLIFLVGLVLFVCRIIGGGDVKLLTATTLLIGYYDVFSFLLLMSVFGALVSLVLFVMHRFKVSGVPVPYGVAIAAAGIVTLLSQSSFSG